MDHIGSVTLTTRDLSFIFFGYQQRAFYKPKAYFSLIVSLAQHPLLHCNAFPDWQYFELGILCISAGQSGNGE